MFPKNLIFAIIILMFISPEEIKFMRAAELSVNTKEDETYSLIQWRTRSHQTDQSKALKLSFLSALLRCDHWGVVSQCSLLLSHIIITYKLYHLYSSPSLTTFYIKNKLTSKDLLHLLALYQSKLQKNPPKKTKDFQMVFTKETRFVFITSKDN